MLAVHAGLLIDGTGARSLKEATLLVEGDRIARVARRSEGDVPIGADVLDLSDKVLIPGFVDAHTHLTSGGGRRDPRGPSAHESESALVFARSAQKPGETRCDWPIERGWWWGAIAGSVGPFR